MSHHSLPTRRDVLARTTAAAAAVVALPKLARADAPASTVAVIRCRSYQDDVTGKLNTLFDQIGGIDKLVRGKTVALKLNLTGKPMNFPIDPQLPYRTNPETVAATVHLLGKAGARRVRILESFFPARQDMDLWARYGLDVNAINNLGPKVEWENVQNLGQGKKYVRLKVPWGGYMFPAYTMNHSVCRLRCVRFAFENEKSLDCGRHHVSEEQFRKHALLSLWWRLRPGRQRTRHAGARASVPLRLVDTSQRHRSRTASGFAA